MKKCTDDKIKQLLNRYIDGVYNYLEFASKSPLINNDKKSIHLGFRTITHIFHTNYIQTGDMDIVYLSMQKGYLYYLEFLEQLKENNISDDLNHTNAILFVHSKALVNYSEDNRCSDNIDETLISKMKIMSKLIEMLFWWDNSEIIQYEITRNILKALTNMLIHSDDSFIVSYIEFSQRRVMNHIEYMEFLDYSVKLLKETMKTGLPKQIEWEKNNITKINDIETNSKEFTIRKWCKWVME
jgi:hypothetical protein